MKINAFNILIFLGVFNFLPSIILAIPVSCLSHGGISCNKGADADGSVICLDGYRDAVTPYRFYCSSAKLKIESVKVENEFTAKIFVNNENQVKAKNVKIYLSSNQLKPDDYEINGPQEINGNSLEQYEFKLKNNKQLKGIPNDIAELIKVRCENCN